MKTLICKCVAKNTSCQFEWRLLWLRWRYRRTWNLCMSILQVIFFKNNPKSFKPWFKLDFFHLRFYCTTQDTNLPDNFIMSQKVDDGVCDCCDGSDELNKRCKNNCNFHINVNKQNLAKKQQGHDRKRIYLEAGRGQDQIVTTNNYRTQLDKFLKFANNISRSMVHWEFSFNSANPAIKSIGQSIHLKFVHSTKYYN